MDTISTLSDKLSDSLTLKLCDSRASGWPGEISGADLVERSSVWAKSLYTIEPVQNALILVMIRVSVNSTALLLGALQAGLFPVVLKPTSPITSVIESVKEYAVSLIAVPIASATSYEEEGFSRAYTSDGFVILRSPFVATPHHGVDGQRLLGIFSSGTTGKPKVIVHTLERVLLNASLHANSIGLAEDDRIALTLPLSFSAGLVAGLFSTLIVEAKGIFVDSQKLNPRAYLSSNFVSVCMGTPATISSYFHDSTLATARIVTVGGDTTNLKLAENLLSRVGKSCHVFATYGMTEAGPRISSCRLSEELLLKYGGIPLGTPLEGVKWDIEFGQEDRRFGELFVDTRTAMYGYLNIPHSHNPTQNVPFGTIRTGDVVKVQDGLPFFMGRSSRVIVRGGENIYPALIESLILKHLSCEDVWVTGQADERLGQIAVAYVVCGDFWNVERAVKVLKRFLPNSHIPAIWTEVSRLPNEARK